MEIRKTAELGTLGNVNFKCTHYKVHPGTRLPAQVLSSPSLAANLLCEVKQDMALFVLSLDLRKCSALTSAGHSDLQDLLVLPPGICLDCGRYRCW